jgi:hypothetical protein
VRTERLITKIWQVTSDLDKAQNSSPHFALLLWSMDWQVTQIREEDSGVTRVSAEH